MALFNNPYPMTYQNPYMTQSLVQQTPVVQQPQNNSIIWVSGEAGANAYLVAPNTTVQLWDSEAQTIYLKSADASGMPSMKIIDYTIRGAEMPNNGSIFDDNKFISREEFNGLKSELEALKSELSNLKAREA